MRILDIARLSLTVLGIAAAAAVVGCHAHTLHVYNSTRLDDAFFLPPLWPGEFDLRPTVGLLVGGAVVVLAGLIYILLGIVPVVSGLYVWPSPSSEGCIVRLGVVELTDLPCW